MRISPLHRGFVIAARTTNACAVPVFIALAFAAVATPLLHPEPLPQSSLERSAYRAVPAKSWAIDAASREIALITHSDSYVRYRQRINTDKDDEFRDVIESKDGAVARLIKRDNRPLTAEEDQAERDRLTSLMDHPSEYARHVKNDDASKRLAIDMIHLMPSAMVYTYAPDQTPSPESSAPQVVLDYSPDPAFNPPNTTSAALTGLRGRVWIDANSKTIVHMTGEIFRGVNFGWGMIAHIYPGGKLDLAQAAVAGPRWNMTHFREDITARALMVKAIAIKKEFHSLDFESLPNAMSYQEAIRLLLNTPLPK